MSNEIVYLGHDNTIDLVAKSDGTAQDLSDVTKITVTFGDTTISSIDKASGVITWDQTGYDTGEFRMDLGDQAISAGKYKVPVVIYDAENTNGIVWGFINIEIKIKP